MLPPVQIVRAEAKTIVESNHSIPGQSALVTLDRMFGGAKVDSDLPAFRDQQYHSGQLIIENGKVPDRIITVIKGIAIIEANDFSTEEYNARPLFPSEAVGLVETLAGRPARYSVIASTECTVRSITRKDLISHLSEHPEQRSQVVRLLADLVRDADRLVKGL